ALATSEHLTGFHDDHDYFIKQAHDEGLLTDAQVIEHGMAMAEAIGEPGWMGLGFALDEAGAGEASDEAWRRVMQTEKADGDELHYIEHMIESNRFDLALEYLADIKPDGDDETDTKADLTRQAEEGIAKRDAERADGEGSD
ncbi:MAG: hypothetical protein AAF747_04520, partial [Planctomycetota bacterium]